MLDLRFPTALQMVISLAVADEIGARCTSSELANGLGANPALVRTLVAPLARDGIVVATAGKNGGVRLGRRPEDITLRDVYRAVIDDKRLFTARPDVPSLCVVSTNIEAFFGSLADRAEHAVLSVLAEQTVAQSLAEIRIIDAARIVSLLNVSSHKTEFARTGRRGRPSGVKREPGL